MEHVQESGEAKGLLEVLGVVGVLRFGDAFGVPGHVNDFDARAKHANLGGKLRTAKAWHDDVRVENFDFTRVGLCEFEGVERGVRFENGVAGLPENLRDSMAERGLAIGEKNCGMRGGFGVLRSGLMSFAVARGIVHRKENFKARALARRRVNLNMSMRLADDAVHGGKAEASALALRLRGEKRLENLGARFFVHTGAIVKVKLVR